ncbi:hypothetical protein CD175_01785 [Pseudomonas laurylsulfatiphila]|uniref:Uncharacterized protein n=1 Tax=Pseudomonas laurylsulfatiphila TaxID=2011015 RepID=A0A2S6FRZ7_9PSED|nr:hypothetical protein CD175_01785 [Pseudomonas laurylsulfatiphila]
MLRTPGNPVGASLLAMGPSQPTSMSPDTQPSRASSLPQLFVFQPATRSAPRPRQRCRCLRSAHRCRGR